jgi:hypothetical protein
MASWPSRPSYDQVVRRARPDALQVGHDLGRAGAAYLSAENGDIAFGMVAAPRIGLHDDIATRAPLGRVRSLKLLESAELVFLDADPFKVDRLVMP